MASISELLLRQGEILANQRLQSAQRQADLVQNLGNIAVGAFNDYQRQKAEAPLLAYEQRVRDLKEKQLKGQIAGQEAEQQDAQRVRNAGLALDQFTGLMGQTSDDELLRQAQETNPSIVDSLRERLNTYNEYKRGKQTERDDALGALAMAVADSGFDPNYYAMAVGKARHDGVITDDEAKAAFSVGYLNPQTLRAQVQEMIRRSPTATAEVERRRKENQPFTLSEGQVRMTPRLDVTGRQVFDAKGNPVFDEQRGTEKPQTFSAPEEYVINGKRMMVQMKGGQPFDMNGRPITSILTIQKWREPKDERLVQVMGKDGTTIWVPESQAAGKQAPQPPKAVTQVERQNLAFYHRMKDAVNFLEKPDASGQSLEQRMASLGVMGQQRLGYEGVGSNYMKSPEMQQYRQAQRAFTEARLRKESGAAILSEELENDAKTYFVQPNDDPATVARKQASRAELLQGLGYSAGKAYDEWYGEPFKKNAKSGFYTIGDMAMDPATNQWKQVTSIGPNGEPLFGGTTPSPKTYKVGDLVTGPDGKPHKIIEISPDGTKYRLKGIGG